MKPQSIVGLCGLTFLLGCLAAETPAVEEEVPAVEEEAPVATVASAISNGQPAQIWMQQRAVAISSGGCTGTIISNTHVLTAAH